MSKLAEILGGKDGQMFTLPDYTSGKRYRLHDGRREIWDGSEWIECFDEGMLSKLIDGKIRIEWQSVYTNQQIKECRWIREMFPETTDIEVRPDVGRNRVWVHTPFQKCVITYCSMAFQDEQPTSYSINDILGE